MASRGIARPSTLIEPDGVGGPVVSADRPRTTAPEDVTDPVLSGDRPRTTAAEWVAGARRWPIWVWPPARRLVVIAPHPDDECLGVGGLIADRLLAGWPVLVVAVTDGEAAFGRHESCARLAEARRAEQRLGLHRLARPAGRAIALTRLVMADGEVAASEERLAAALAPLLAPGDACLAPFEHDGHPDHEACGRAARRSCALAGAGHAQYPVWAWHWSTPSQLERWAPRRVPMSAAARRAKQAARRAHRSQIGPSPGGGPPIVPSSLCRLLSRPLEVLLS